MKISLLLLIFVLTFLKLTYAQQHNIIPCPQKITIHQSYFQIDENTNISTHNIDTTVLSLFANQLRISSGLHLKFTKKKTNKSISFEIDKKLNLPNSDGYTLIINEKGVNVKAINNTGIFHATQTLRLLLQSEFESGSRVEHTLWRIPYVEIMDYPRYNWRGYMKDVSRTFYSVEVIKKYLDAMALYKMNTFHWHLTDDQGWRIEIKKYPDLTSKKTTTFHHTTNQPAERSGFYTQYQIREIVEYAKERQITIVPEIDVPGHSWPTLLVYPELGVNKNSYPNHVFPFVASWSYWGTQFTPNTLDPTKEIVYDFLDNVFMEIADLFPGEYIHFGGDEVRHALWENEPHIQKFMVEKNIHNVHELQSYFVNRVSAIIEKKGKKPIGWNDILKGAESLSRSTAIMSWLGESATKEATHQGFYTIATPSSHLYFDITQEDRNDGTVSDLAYPHIITLKKVYEFDPAGKLTDQEEKYLLGVQANQWPAVPQEVKDINVQNFPRLLAVAEIGWASKENKDYEKFYGRVQANYARLDSMRIDYFLPGGYKIASWKSNDIQEEYKTITYDVTSQIYTNGRAQAGFFFTDGDNFLEIDGAQLLENGTIVSEDRHHALADNFRGTNKIKPYLFNFKIDNYDPTAKYEIRALVRVVGGINSKGNVTFNLSPYRPFDIVKGK